MHLALSNPQTIHLTLAISQCTYILSLERSTKSNIFIFKNIIKIKLFKASPK